MAEKLGVCVQGLTPVLFHVRPSATVDISWLEDLAVISGRVNNRIDGTKFIAEILRDGTINHDEKKIILPKRAVIRDKGNKELVIKDI